MTNHLRLALTFVFALTLAQGFSQSFLELDYTEEADLKKVIAASQEDKSRKKTFFAYIKLGSLYLKNNKIPECDSVLNIIESGFNDYIRNGIKWHSMDVSDYYHLLSSLYYLKNDNQKSKVFLEKAQAVNPDVFSYSNNLYRIFVREGKLDSAETYLRRSFPVISRNLDVNKLDDELLKSFDLTFRNMCQLKIMQGDIDGLEFYLSKWLSVSKQKLNNPASIRKRKLDKLDAWQTLYLSKYSLIKGHADQSKAFLERIKPRRNRRKRVAARASPRLGIALLRAEYSRQRHPLPEIHP